MSSRTKTCNTEALKSTHAKHKMRDDYVKTEIWPKNNSMLLVLEKEEEKRTAMSEAQNMKACRECGLEFLKQKMNDCC